MSKVAKNPETSAPGAPEEQVKAPGISRRTLLAGGASAAFVGLAGSMGAKAQYSGIMEEGLGVPFRLPMGALNYLDRNQYIHNMEIISYTEGGPISSGEPLMTMWASGSRRLIASEQGWLDVTDPRKPEVIDLGMRMRGTVSFQESTGKWIFMRTHGEPLTGAEPGHPFGHWHDEVYRMSIS